MSKKRLRIFAGPNGSGKSTIFSAVDKKVGCKYFVNADEIYKSLSETGCLSFDYYTILPQEDSFLLCCFYCGFSAFQHAEYRPAIHD